MVGCCTLTPMVVVVFHFEEWNIVLIGLLPLIDDSTTSISLKVVANDY
jgi:hypothetical protein